uniref:Cilia- and flagella-associated protein 300 n=1 Tax=Poecilia reticulata TaxID=8081 RepID=A0A3P9NGM6_POERE
MLGRLSAQTYSFDSNFHPYSCETFALVRRALMLYYMYFAVKYESRPVESVSTNLVPCTKISMELFDPVYSCGILRPSGHVVKCFHDVYPDYDELRQMLQEEDSEHYYVVGRMEREEFLFRLFKHLCLGGELCQYEDTIDPYISTTKKIYKDLIRKRRLIKLFSRILVSSYSKDESGQCFPGTREEEQTFAYLIVDPVKRNVTLLYHIYGVGKMTL